MPTINPLMILTNSCREFSRVLVLNRYVNKFNKTLLISLRVRRTLIRIFSADHEIFTETDTNVSAAQANATGSWENSSERTQFLIKFGSAQAKLQRIFSLFCWDCAALGGQNIGREISKFEKRREKRNVDKDAQRALSYNLVSSFRVISLHIYLMGSPDCEDLKKYM